MNYLTERRQEEKERRRAEIIDAAEAVAADGGWEALTMEQVARNARLSRALVYVYFKDKIDLMYGICERGLALLTQRFEAAAARHRRGIDQVTAIGRAYVAFSQEFPVYFDVLARCELREVNTADATENQQACQRTGDQVHKVLIAVLEGGVADGSVRADLGDRMLAATALWGFTHGVVLLAVTKAKLMAHHGVDVRALLDQAIDMATRSVAARS